MFLGFITFSQMIHRLRPKKALAELKIKGITLSIFLVPTFPNTF